MPEPMNGQPENMADGVDRLAAPAPADPARVEAFMRLFATHRRRVYQYILSLLPNLQDADDVLQETNIILWRKFDEYRDGTSFLAWASKVAYFEVLKHRRRLARAGRGVVVLDDQVLEQLAADARDNQDQLEHVRDALQGCLKKLSPTDQKLIAFRYGAGAKGRDVAEQLGRPANSVYKSLGRIRAALLECVTRTLRLSEWPGGVA